MNPQLSKYNKNQNRPTPYNNANFASKKEMLSWASTLLDLNIEYIEQLTTGAIFCQLLDVCHPGSVRMNRVNWSANNEKEYIDNYKIFQQGLIENNIIRNIDIKRLSNGKQQELNDLLQWIYGYYLDYRDNYQGAYNAKRSRGNQNFVFVSHNHNNKNKYRKKQIIKDNYSSISLSSNNSVNSDINSNYSNYNNRGNNFNNLKKNFRNNSHKRYNMNNFNNNLRNKSKKESKNSKYNEFYQERVMNNNKNDFSFSPNIPNNNRYKKNNYNNNINNNSYYTQNRNYTQNNIYRTNNNFQTNKFEESNNINMENVSSNKSRNFPNIFESKTNSNNVTNNLNLNHELYNNNNGQFDREDEELYNNNIESDDDGNYSDNDMDIDMADYNGLNENEVQNIIQEGRKDGNNIGDLKRIIRKLRISEIKNEKRLKNIHKIVNNLNREKLFYLNKLKDIEYLYFNPIIKNPNDNKNTILRQLLCSEEDTTIYLDEHNYAYLQNKKNKNGVNINYQKYKSQPPSTKKSKNKKIEKNELKNLNYSSKKNYDNNYTNNLFDSNSNYICNDNENEKINDYNDGNNFEMQSNININISDNSNANNNVNSNAYNIYGTSNNNTNDNSAINSFNYSQNTTKNQINYKKSQVSQVDNISMELNKKNNNINHEEEYYSNNNNNKNDSIVNESSKANYDNQSINEGKKQKIIKIKLSNDRNNTINFMSQNAIKNENENALFNNNNFSQNENQNNIKKIIEINNNSIQQINNNSMRRNIQDENLNQNLSYKNNMDLYNGGKSVPNSNRKENKLLHEEKNEDNMTKMNTKTEIKANNIYNNITSGLLNESLVIHGYEKE